LLATSDYFIVSIVARCLPGVDVPSVPAEELLGDNLPAGSAPYTSIWIPQGEPRKDKGHITLTAMANARLLSNSQGTYATTVPIYSNNELSYRLTFIM